MIEDSCSGDVVADPAQGRHYVVIVFPDFGFINPTLEMARELVARGNRVTYVTDERFLGLVTSIGAILIGYKSSRSSLPARDVLTMDELLTVGIDYLVESMDVVLPLVRTILNDDVPDMILYDFEGFAPARILGRHWDRPTAQLSPYLASNQEYSVRKQMIDRESAQSMHAMRVLWKFLESNGVDPNSIETFSRDYDDLNIVFMPRDFQPHGDGFDESFVFVGPCIAADTGAIQWTPPNENRNVLISLGTESNKRPGFFRTCAGAFEDKSWHVVMTLGRGRNPADLSITAPNVEAHEWLPHPVVLPHMSVLICHGGLGSIMESLYFGVPVVIVPQTPEHLLNGQRACELGVARMLHSDEMSAETLSSVVEDVAGDPDIRKRVNAMRDSMMAAGGAQRAADQLESWLVSSAA